MVTENEHTGLDYVHPTAITAWQLIGTVLGIFVILVFAAWTIVTNEAQNNRSISDDLKTSYVTKSNHDDLVNRFIREVTRVDKLGDDKLSRDEFIAGQKERDKEIKTLKAEIEFLRNNYTSRSEFNGVVSERGKQIDSLREESKKYTTKDEMLAHVEADKERVMSLRREVDALRSELKPRP